MKPDTKTLIKELENLFDEVSPKSSRLRRVVNHHDKEEIISKTCAHCLSKIYNNQINSVVHLRSIFFLRLFYDGLDSRPKYMAKMEKFDDDYDLENITAKSTPELINKISELLTFAEPELAARIQQYLDFGFKVTDLAKLAKVNKSTISRQIQKDITTLVNNIPTQVLTELKN